MARTMAERLEEARARTFVGRQTELATFDAVLAAEEPALIVVHGPPGIGKSTLARELARRAQERGCTCWMLDARDLPPSLESLELRLAPLLTGEPWPGRRCVVVIDGYELIETVDRALREELAPRLPGDVVIVLAGQHPPSVGWRTDPGWAPLLHQLRLDNLAPPDCGRYLEAREVPPSLHAAAIAFSHGHPLALALVGEVIRQKGSLSAPDSADVVRSLMDRLLAGVPSPEHRATLEAAAEVRNVDEPLLAALLGRTEVYELFDWLRTLPYVQGGAHGLVLHDLVRDVVAGDLRWRHPERHAELHDRARAHYLERLDSPDPAVAATALFDLIFLHPDLRAILQASEESAALRLDRATSDDAAAIEQMVAVHEGPESAEVARHWLAAQPDSWSVVRQVDGQVAGAVCLLPLEAVEVTDDDPSVLAARAELATHPPLRPGETATLFRFWLARETYQSVSAAQSIIATAFARHFLTTRGLAVTVIPFADPQPWEEFCAYTDQRRAPVADFTVGGRTYACFAHDWRIVPPAAWLARLSRQEVGTGGEDSPPEPTDSGVLVLDEAAFAAAVRQALRDYSRPDRLRGSPLLRCRIVTSRLMSGEAPAEQVEVLRAQLKEAVDSLAEVPADRRLQRVLVRAYLSPARSLERAAEVLELPSSTFRRLLSTAIGRVTTLLWHRELDA